MGGTERQTDEELVCRFQQSEAVEHLDELARRYVPKVRQMVFHMVLSDADTDDLVQEIFIRAFRGLAGFRGRSRFSTWLYRVTMNTVKSFLAARARSPVETVASVPDREGSRLDTPDRHVVSAERVQQIESALGGLPPKLRAALVLTAIHGIGPAEVARIEGCATATVYWRVHQARKHMKRELRQCLQS